MPQVCLPIQWVALKVVEFPPKRQGCFMKQENLQTLFLRFTLVEFSLESDGKQGFYFSDGTALRPQERARVMANSSIHIRWHRDVPPERLHNFATTTINRNPPLSKKSRQRSPKFSRSQPSFPQTTHLDLDAVAVHLRVFQLSGHQEELPD